MKRTTSIRKTPVPEATFVFRGTIKKLKASNVRQAAVSARTAIVTVDHTIEAPPNLAAYTGQDITVELSTSRNVKAGDKMIFYADVWLYGESIAVRSSHEEPDTGTAIVEPQVKAYADQGEREIRRHFQEADLVVSGKVMAVRLPEATATATRKTAAPANQSTHVSEHDPKWREAIILVEQVHKGTHKPRELVVRFPSSKDVAWRHAPKFEVGQQGYFVLHRDKSSGARASKKQRNSTSATSAASEIYTVRDAADFQPSSQPGGIKALVESKSASR